MSDGSTVTSRLLYGLWGEVSSIGSLVSDLGYTAHYYDRGAAINLTWFRVYDSALGRWLSRDPLGLMGGANLYGYVTNTPISLVDPTGLQAEKCVLNPCPVGDDYCNHCVHGKQACRERCEYDAQRIYDGCVARGGTHDSCEYTRRYVMIKCGIACNRCASP